jgi:hypothetical protein
VCVQHYLVLQGNLVAIASELDNYPTEETDAYAHLGEFPDKIMRKDCLDELFPFEERSFPSPPIMPACIECVQAKVSITNIISLLLSAVDFLDLLTYLFIYFIFFATVSWSIAYAKTVPN